ERLRAYPWPGNMRELQSVLKQALLRAHGPVLLPEFLPEFPEAPAAPAAPMASPRGDFDPEAFLRQRLGPDSRDLYAEIHRELDRLLLPPVPEHTPRHQAPAPPPPGLPPRSPHTKPAG